MADPKKPDDPKKPADEPIPAPDMSYPTPPLDPKTGAPIDTRFQSDSTKEETAEQSPKSAAGKKPEAQNGDDEEEEDDDEVATAPKGKEKPARRR